MPTTTEYQQLVADLFTARRNVDDAHAGWAWAQHWDPAVSRELAQRLDRARSHYWHTVDQLVAYILTH